jgi:hypothetical protein
VFLLKSNLKMFQKAMQFKGLRVLICYDIVLMRSVEFADAMSS